MTWTKVRPGVYRSGHWLAEQQGSLPSMRTWVLFHGDLAVTRRRSLGEAKAEAQRLEGLDVWSHFAQAHFDGSHAMQEQGIAQAAHDRGHRVAR